MRPLKNKDYYLAQEVVDKFGISKKTLFDWEKQGIINLNMAWSMDCLHYLD